MQNILICAALVILPFIHLPGWDNREIKFVLSGFFALLIFLNQIWKDGLKGTRNVWFLLLLGYLFIHPNFMPIFKISIQDAKVGAFWIYQPMYFIVIFALFYLAVSSISRLRVSIECFFTAIEWVAFVTALYMILQHFGIDQFFKPLVSEQIKNTPSAQMIGAFNHPILASTFLSMCVPVLLHKGNWIRIITVVSVIVLSKSMMGIASLAMCVILYYGVRNLSFLIQLIVALSALTIPYWDLIRKLIVHESSGRLGIWSFIFQDFIHPIHHGITKTYALTGNGIGSFRYISQAIHNSPWKEAHNDYLEFLYNCGFIGLFLLLMALWTVLKPSFKQAKSDPFVRVSLCSLVSSCVAAFGTFNWQMGAHIFYTVFFAGILTNLTLEN